MLLAATTAVSAAHAQPDDGARIVTIGADAQLEQALEIAFTSWRAKVVPSTEPPPGRDLDDAIRTAHRIARSSGARGVVWLVRNPPGDSWSLWVYDDHAHQIAIRPLPSAPPYDDATSAAIALTVKTLLLGAFESPPLPPRLPDEETRRRAPPKPPSATHAVRIHTLGGVRVPTHATDSLAARFGAEITYFPPLPKHELGAALAVDAGPSVLVQHDPYFAGTFTDTIASLTLRYRLPLRRWLALELGAGPGLHFSALEGSSAQLHLSGRVNRTDVSLETMLGVEFAWKVLRVSPFVGASFLLRYQHYRVEDVQVLDVPVAQMLYGLRIGVELP